MGGKVKKRWGYYKILLKGKGFWIKQLELKNGKGTSLQTHKKRSELWMIYVPRGCKHQLSGHGNVVELALGDPKERDIIRYKYDKTKT